MTDVLDHVAGTGGPEAAAAPRPPTDRPPSPSEPPPALPAATARPLAALLAGAGAAHMAMAPSHLGESAVEGAGFVAAAWLQLGLAVTLLGLARRGGAVPDRSRPLLAATAGLSAALVAAWAVSRTAGLPFGGHAGHAEAVTVVDGACVVLEVAAVALAAAALARRPLRSRRPAAAGALLALALATAAVVSPAARDHAADSHGDHATGDHATGDHGTSGAGIAPVDAADDEASGFAELVNGHHHDRGAEPLTPDETATLARQLAATTDLVARYPTLGDARAAGYRRNGPFTPGLGTHYAPPDAPVNTDGDMDPEDLAAAYLIYDGLGDDAPLAGFMFLAVRPEEPEGFAGPNDHWHYHDHVCVVTHPDGTLDSPLAADTEGTTEANCDAIGGTWIDFTGYMVHVWNVPGYESPDGTFTEVNRAITCPDGTYHRVPLTDIVGRDDLCLGAAG
jgi:hypothetical protein